MDTHALLQMAAIVAEKKMLPTNLLIIEPDSMLILPNLAIIIDANSNQNQSCSSVREWDLLFTIRNILRI